MPEASPQHGHSRRNPGSLPSSGPGRARSEAIVQNVSTGIGFLSGLAAIVEFFSSHFVSALILVFVVVLAAIAYSVRRQLWRFRRDIGFFFLGAFVTAAVFLLWQSAAKPSHREPPPIQTRTQASQVSPPAGTPASTPTISTVSVDLSEIVYRTPSGHRYHRADCRHLGRNGSPITLAQARDQSLTPCLDCHPTPLP